MRKRVLILLLSISSLTYAQTDRFVDYGIIRVQGNLGMGKPLNYDATNMYWCGDLDYYFKGNISVRTGFNLFLGSYGNDKVFQHNHSAYLGAAFHIPTNNHFDPYIAFEPTYVISRIHPDGIYSDAQTQYKYSLNPALGMSVGCTYYANKFFNVFANVRYQKGKHYSDVSVIDLDEIRISFGLGYMIWARKNYFRFRRPDSMRAYTGRTPKNNY